MNKMQFTRLMAILVLLGHTTIASAVGLLLPAVQSVRESAVAEPLSVDIDGLGRFEASAVAGLPIISFGFQADSIDVQIGRQTIGSGELLSMNLASEAPVLVGGDLFDVFIELSPPDSILPVNFIFESTSDDGTSAQGRYDSVFDILLEVTLVDILDRTKVETFMHDGTLHVFGNWRSAGRQLIFDNSMQVEGVVKGSLTTVPVPASLWLMMTGIISLVACSRRKLQSAIS